MKGKINKLEKIIIFSITVLILVLSILIIIYGICGLREGDYLALGDPFHKSQILALERAPLISRLAIFILILVFIELALLIFRKKDERLSEKK